MSGLPGEVRLQPAYILHRRPYHENSLLLEVLSRDHGRVGLVGRGASRPRSPMRAAVQPFQPVVLSWYGRGELGTLCAAEAAGAPRPLVGRLLAVGFYLNEIILRLLVRHDPHPGVFESYGMALESLQASAPEEPVLRIFERDLLHEVGYGLSLRREAEAGTPIRADARYRYLLDLGPVPASAETQDEPDAPLVQGSTLLALASGRLMEPEALREAKRLMRAALRRQLGDRPLRSREIFGRSQW